MFLKLFNFIMIILSIWMFNLHVYLCTTVHFGAHGSQKRAPEPLELE